MSKHRVLMSSLISLLTAATLASTATRSPSWDQFWHAHSVDPPPPRDFMGSAPAVLNVLNLTNASISDATARRWVEADFRRGQGDLWAACHLRLDIVNAGVLGPPGLHGTDQFVSAELAKGTVALSCAPGFTIEKMAVVAVSEEMKRKHAGAGLTDFVIVTLFRSNGVVGTRTLADGRKESLPSRRKQGDLSWQLDAGEFRENATIGPLWYQAMGWSCGVTEPGTLDDICGLVRPNYQQQTRHDDAHPDEPRDTLTGRSETFDRDGGRH
jgi:hypothetical protein